MSFETDLLHDLGGYVAANGAGTYHRDGDGYAGADNPIYWDALPGAPDRATAMSLYPVDDDGTLSTVGVQFRFRGRRNNRADTKDLSASIDDILNGLERVTWAGVDVVRVWRQSGADLGPDGNNRQEITRTYYIQYTRATALRTD